MEGLGEESCAIIVDTEEYNKIFTEILKIVDDILNGKENGFCRCSDILLRETIVAYGKGGLGVKFRNIELWDIGMISKITMRILNKDI